MSSSKSRRELIAAEAERFRRLTQRIDETVRTRSRSPQDYAAWKEACAAWHTYRGPLSDFIHRAYRERPYSDPELLEQAICFLEEDPWFFRSGYHKARILETLKRTELKERHCKRLRAVLVDAVLRRGAREYRRYCRLAAVLVTDELVATLERLAANSEGAQASRAKLMLKIIWSRVGDPS